MRHFAIPAALGFAAMIASPAISQDRTVDPQAKVSEIHDRFETAMNAGNTANLASLYGQNALLLPSRAERAEGRAAIQRFFQTGIQERGFADLTIHPTEVRRVGDAIYDLGTYRMRAKGPGGEQVRTGGDYLALLEPAGDGQWQITRHIWNEAPRGAQQ